MRRLKWFGAVVAAALVLGTTLTMTPPALADSSARASSVAVDPVPLPPVSGATVQCEAGGLCGLVGPLLGPVLNGLVNPLLGAVQTLPNSLLTPLTNALAGGLRAASANAHSGAAPSSCASPWTSGTDCYGVTGLSANAAPLLGLGLGAITGYTETNSAVPATQPATGASSVALAGVNVLGIALVGGGVVTSESDCPTLTAAPPSSHSAVANLSLLGGLLTVNAADGSNALSVAGLGSNLTISDPLGGLLPVTATLNGNLLTVSVGLTLADLLHGLGLSLPLTDPDSTVKLSLKIDTGRVSDSSSASAWGLRVRVGLEVHFGVDLGGLATLGVDLGNSPLLDLKLASTNCTGTAGSGSGGSGNSVIPPALT